MRAGRRGPAAAPQGVFHAVGYRCTVDRRAHRAGLRRHRRRRGRAGPGALRVPDRRRARLAALRLRPAAARRAGRGRRRGPRASCSTSAGTRAAASGCWTSCGPTSCRSAGADTVDANLALGLPADAREYGTGAQVLADLGIESMRLLTNNPAKRAGLRGLRAARSPAGCRCRCARTRENLRYLTTKRDRMGHDLRISTMAARRVRHSVGPGREAPRERACERSNAARRERLTSAARRPREW